LRALQQKLAVLVQAGTLALGVGAWSSCHDSTASIGADPASSSAEPQVPDVVLPGIDVSAMTPRERREFSSLVASMSSPCAQVPVPVSQCVLEKRPCPLCAQAAKWIAAAVRQGAGEGAIARAYKERFDPSAAKSIPVDGSPTKGPDDAPVTVVEFADFECPHCAAAVPLVDAVVAAHPGKVRLVYKFFPLAMHVHGEAAARAAYAASMQGKFWEMHHLLFERQDNLEQGDLERYAKALKLDVAKWKADMESQAVKDRVDADRKLGDSYKIVGTPTIYVNGRELDSEADEPLEERVAIELGVPPVAAPSAGAPSAGVPSGAPTGSAAPSAAPSAKPH
jgi:protein-disulfide isomerase